MAGIKTINSSLCVLFVVFVSTVLADTVSVSFDERTGRYSLNKGAFGRADSLAWGTFSDKVNKTGWSFLEVYTNGSQPNLRQAYAAGLVEGVLTRDIVTLFWHNTMQNYCTSPLSAYCIRLRTFIKTNSAWVQKQIQEKAHTDPYWQQVELYYVQMNGLRDGFHNLPSSEKQPLVANPLDMFVLMTISGDLEDLESALQKEDKVKIVGSGSCSALIKLLPGNRDLYVSQDSWNGFNTMLRILKKYDFQFHQTGDTNSPIIPGSVMTFSSYPGFLTSGDDFYTINTGLATLETTIGNENASLWSLVKPTGCVLEGARSMVANRLATSGGEWSQIFTTFNSGTYNNQWMVVDYKKFTPGKATLTPGLIYVLEQIPGLIVSRDLTSLFQKQTYWPSYNSAFFPEVFKASGGEENVKKYGSWFSYDHTPRANIFRRDHGKVKDIKSMTKLMRYNDFTHDPLSRCNCTPPYSAENAISARSDLNPPDGVYPFSALRHRSHGGIDMKLTTSDLAKSLDFIAIGGPTYDQVSAFQWSKSDFKTTAHLGQPDLWKFEPIKTRWSKRKTSQ